MLLYTAQPEFPDPSIPSVADTEGLSSHLGYRPAFCSYVSESSLADFWFRVWSAAPRHPERIVVIDVPSADAEPMDVMEWTNLISRRRRGGRQEAPGRDEWLRILGNYDDVSTDYLIPEDMLETGAVVLDVTARQAIGERWWADASLYGGGRALTPTEETLGAMDAFLPHVQSACRELARTGTFSGLGADDESERAYAAMLDSSVVTAIWCLVTGRSLAAPAFAVVPQLLESQMSFFDAQLRLRRWDENMACGRETHHSVLRRTHRDFLRILRKAEQKALDGMVRSTGVRRSAPCPCGSGRRYGKCHARIGGIDDMILAMSHVAA